MDTREILVDLQATKAFVVGEITERADDTPFEEAVELVDELTRVAAAVKDAITMLNGSILKQLEGGSRQIGTRVYAVMQDSAKRTDHTAVRLAVINHAMEEATDASTGVVMARRAVGVAVNDMMHLYVPQSRVATTGGLKRIGASPKAVNYYENKGKKLTVVDLAMPKDNDDDDE